MAIQNEGGNTGQKKTSPILVFAAGFGVLAAFVLYLAYSSYQISRHSIQNYRTASGKVVSLTVVDGAQSSTAEAPVVHFQTPGGTEITFSSEVATNPPSHAVGETVEVLYDPEFPQKAVINSFVHLWLLSTALAGVGSLLLVVSLGAFYLARSDR